MPQTFTKKEAIEFLGIDEKTFNNFFKNAEEFKNSSRPIAAAGEVRIHSPKGPIRDSDTVPPGNDPNPPLDQKH